MTSIVSGFSTSRAANASIRTFSTVTPELAATHSPTTSSQNGMVWMMPLDLVAETSRPRRCCASSIAYRATRSIPARVKTASWTAISSGRPR